jgi:hypothetical protein
LGVLLLLLIGIVSEYGCVGVCARLPRERADDELECGVTTGEALLESECACDSDSARDGDGESEVTPVSTCDGVRDREWRSDASTTSCDGASMPSL